MNESIIYMAQCTVDRDQLYVGKTDRTLEERKKEHEQAARTGSPTAFHQALLAEGLKHWEWRELERCSPEQAIGRERHWIEKLGALSIDLLNVAHSRRRKPTGVVRKQELGRKLGGKNVWKKPSARRWLMLSGRLRPVMNLSTGKQYGSLSEAARYEADDRPGIKRSCDTGRPTLLGNRYAWLDVDDQPLLTEGHEKRLPRTKRVKNLSTRKVYDSAKEAARAHNVSSSQVYAVCRGEYQTCKGMSFCYVDDDGKEQLTATHHKYRDKQNQAATTAFAAYHIEDTNFENPYVFDTSKELSDMLSIPQSHILAVCRGERQHVKGFRIAFFDRSKKQPQLTDAHRRPIARRIRQVICLDDDKAFPSPAAAARHYGLNASQVCLCCKGELKSTGRQKGRRRFAYIDEQGNPILTPKHRESFSVRGMRVFCPQLGQEYQSIAEFCRETGVPQKRVRKHLEDPMVDLGGLELVRL